MSSLAGHVYEFEPHEGPRTLLLLHGTGGNENDLLPLGRELDPHAHLLSPLGNVSENGMARFFKRRTEGTFDREDLAVRSAELAAFVRAAAEKHDLVDIVGVGFSNGANILLHMICTDPHLLKAAILLRPMSAALPDSITNLDGLPAFIGAGQTDEMVPHGDSERLESVLRSGGATVMLRMTESGHRLTQEDIDRAREWLARLPIYD